MTNSLALAPAEVEEHKTHEQQKNAYGTSKQHILEAAERLFAENGFAKTTLRAVAQASGANTALVSYYFGSKEGLQQAVIQIQIDKTMKLLEQITEPSRQTWTLESFREQLDEFFDFMKQDEAVYRLLTWALGEREENYVRSVTGIGDMVQKHYSKFIRTLNPMLSNAEVEARSVLIRVLLAKYSELRWGTLGYFQLDQPAEQLLALYQQTITNQIVNALVS